LGLKESQLPSPERNPTASQIQKLKLPLHLPGATPTGLHILTILSLPSLSLLKKEELQLTPMFNTHTRFAKGKKDLRSRCRISNR